MKQYFKLCVTAAACSLLNGCIVLLPFIDTETAAQQQRDIRRPQYSTPAGQQRAAGALRPPPKLRRYMTQLEDSRPTIRTAAASYLGMMGPPALPAVPQLIAKLNDPSKFVRRASAKALGKIGEVSLSRPALEKTVQGDPDPFVRKTAQNALGRLPSGNASPQGLSPTGRSQIYTSK